MSALNVFLQVVKPLICHNFRHLRPFVFIFDKFKEAEVNREKVKEKNKERCINATGGDEAAFPDTNHNCND